MYLLGTGLTVIAYSKIFVHAWCTRNSDLHTVLFRRVVKLIENRDYNLQFAFHVIYWSKVSVSFSYKYLFTWNQGSNGFFWTATYVMAHDGLVKQLWR